MVCKGVSSQQTAVKGGYFRVLLISLDRWWSTRASGVCSESLDVRRRDGTKNEERDDENMDGDDLECRHRQTRPGVVGQQQAAQATGRHVI